MCMHRKIRYNVKIGSFFNQIQRQPIQREGALLLVGDIQHIVYITAIIIYTKTTLLIKVLLNLMVDFSLCLLCSYHGP